MNREKVTANIGFWSSLIAFLGAATYTVSQIISPPLLQILRYPWNEILTIFPSIVLASSFVVAMNCVHLMAPEEKKVWSQIGLSFAIMYAVIVSFVYIIQLGYVIPTGIQNGEAKVAFFAITKSPWIQAVDAIGYCFMGIAALFSFPVFGKSGIELWVKRFFIAHGVLAPFSIFPLWFPVVFPISMLWFITAPGALLSLTLYFKRK